MRATIRSAFSTTRSGVLISAVLLVSTSSSAAEPNEIVQSEPGQSPSAPPAADSDEAATAGEVKPAGDPHRSRSVEPTRAEPAPKGRTTLDVDPVVDGAIVGVGLGIAALTQLVSTTGEIRPQQIAANFDRRQLLGIDRAAVSGSFDGGAAGRSNIAIYSAIGFALLDPILSGIREKHVQTSIVDAFMYAESIAITVTMTNVLKMAVRRPRPRAYAEAAANRGNPDYSNSETDSALAFISGHAAVTAAIGATASYLAFTRSRSPFRPWLTLALAAGMTTFVSVERVRAGAHFPTDVIAGGIAGAGIGIVVPHLHRSTDITQRRVWVGLGPSERGEGGSIQVGGVF